jgi:hypothetical protein
MKKNSLFIILIMSILVKLNAGYVIHGIYLVDPLDDLKNYTLTFHKDYGPIAAVAIHTSFASGSGLNSIAIIPSDNSLLATVFPIAFLTGPDINFDVEVRDFHHDKTNDVYVLCGSRQIGPVARAFVAIVNSNLSQMRLYEYSEADMFYSIWVDYPTSAGIDPGWDYYACGTSGNQGVVCSIDRNSMQFSNFYITETDWEYHKIIAKQNTDYSLYFAASGRNNKYTQIGFSTFDPQFSAILAYEWVQNTDPESHCVVSEDILLNNSVILASSYQSAITLNPITYPIITPTQVTAYQFNFYSWADNSFYVQDIGTIQDGNNIRISVAGNARLSSGFRAWHAYAIGLSNNGTFINNFYGSGYDLYEHYKIRYQQGEEYTGGYYQENTTKRALFGTPLKSADDCDSHYTSDITILSPIDWSYFYLGDIPVASHIYSLHGSYDDDFVAYDECYPFKGGKTPEFAMPLPENETDIINYYDRITVKDTPSDTKYQIYSMTGQLIQTGTTNPDISTEQLTKGIYFLRLENGKAFKFVK